MSWENRRYKPKIRVKRLTEEAVVPTRGTDGSAGLDLYATEEAVLWPGDIRAIGTGIAIEIPHGYWGCLMTRSSFGVRGVRLASGCNCIDSDYRGQVMVVLRNDGENPFTIRRGNRIAQIILTPYLDCYLVETEELSPTSRGRGGFGSTGE